MLCFLPWGGHWRTPLVARTGPRQGSGCTCPFAFLQRLAEVEAMKLQLGEERDALVQRMSEQSQDLEGKRGPPIPSSHSPGYGLVLQAWCVPACPLAEGSWFCLSPLPAVSIPTEQHQRAVRESQGLLQELEEERARYQSLVQEYARLEQGYENLRDEVAFHRVRGWQWHREAQGNPSLGSLWGVGSVWLVQGTLCGRIGLPSSCAEGSPSRGILRLSLLCPS